VSAATHAIDQAPTRDGGDEHFLRALPRIKAAGAAPQVGEDLLYRIFGIRPRPREAPGQRPDEIAEFVHAFRDGAFLTPGNALEDRLGHQCLVSDFGVRQALDSAAA
jgi:hypothetical protein